MRTLATFATAALFAVGCRSTLPVDSPPEPLATMQAATEMGAHKNMRASQLLERARQEIDEARTLHSQGKHEEAAWALRRAEADADLALALARQDAAQAEAAEFQQKLQRFRAMLHDSQVSVEGSKP